MGRRESEPFRAFLYNETVCKAGRKTCFFIDRQEEATMVNIKCPRCGSNHVQLSNEMNKHGCLWTILFGVFYIGWLFIRWMIGAMLFMFYDWWMVTVEKLQKKLNQKAELFKGNG